MDSFPGYILKSTLCIGFLYLTFRLLMGRETCFSLNRVILLAIVAGSVLIPVIHPPLLHTPVQVELIPDFSSNYVHIQNLPVEGSASLVRGPEITRAEGSELVIQLAVLLGYVYWAGFILALVFFMRNILSVVRLIGKSTVQKKEGYRLAIMERDISSFAFGRTIVISRNDLDTYGSAILSHEKAHIRLNHFYDLILLELAKALHWFNPAVYGLIRNIKEIHEFQADVCTLSSGIDRSQYQLLLIKKSVGPERFALANSFNHCQIKKRIAMINKQKNNKAKHWKIALFLPMLAFLLLAFGGKNENTPESLATNGMENQRTPMIAEITQELPSLTDQIIQIKNDGNYIDGKLCSLEEITLQDQAWRNAGNKWILLLIDVQVPYARVDEVRGALQGSYWVVQSTVGSDDMVFFVGDVSQTPNLKQGDWDDWAEEQLKNNAPNLLTESTAENLDISFSFIVDRDGQVRDAHMMRECDDAEINTAIKGILSRIPDWEPAMRGSERVSVYLKFGTHPK